MNQYAPYEAIFQRALTAHLPSSQLAKLETASVLVAGLGGGSNIAELLVRKGIGSLVIADPDIYEEHNVRQRGSLMSTWGLNKTAVMEDRLKDINPYLEVQSFSEGVTESNVSELVSQVDVVVDMLDLHALDEKLALHRESRQQGKYVVTAPSVINGAVLWIFSPTGMTFEEFSGYREDLPLSDYAWSLLNRAIPKFPSPDLKELYQAAAYGKRSIPLDPVGVDQAAVLAVAAIENIVFERWEQVVVAPRGLQVDVTDPRSIVSFAKVDEMAVVGNASC